MKYRLFLTGPIGCGKSTAILRALEEKRTAAGGFLTRRYREPCLHFTLESPDGRKKETFLDFPDGNPRLHTEVFETLGVQLLQGEFLILDEIGGVELLCPIFSQRLKDVLNSRTPVIGVMKGEGPASSLIRTLGLTEEYEKASALLRTQLRSDENTLFYECSQFDETAWLLAENWVKEYCP